MGRKSSKKLDTLAEQVRSKGTPVMEAGHEVWLAGLGALSVARKKGGKVAGKGSKMFDRLVAEGQKLEKKVGKAVRSDAHEVAERISKTANKSKVQAKKVAEKVLPKRKGPVTLHLVPRDDQWIVRLKGSEEVLSVHSPKDSAVKAARVLARSHAPSHLVVHRADGTVQESFSYD